MASQRNGVGMSAERRNEEMLTVWVVLDWIYCMLTSIFIVIWLTKESQISWWSYQNGSTERACNQYYAEQLRHNLCSPQYCQFRYIFFKTEPLKDIRTNFGIHSLIPPNFHARPTNSTILYENQHLQQNFDTLLRLLRLELRSREVAIVARVQGKNFDKKFWNLQFFNNTNVIDLKRNLNTIFLFQNSCQIFDYFIEKWGKNILVIFNHKTEVKWLNNFITTYYGTLCTGSALWSVKVCSPAVSLKK